MKKMLGAVGFIIMLMGVSGTIDHLWRQPILGWFLNRLNREVFTKIDWLVDYALFANIIVIVLGVVILAGVDRLPQDE